MFDRPHDALVKAIFGQASHAAGLLRTGLPDPLAAALDFDTLGKRPGSFLDHPREITADLVFAVRPSEDDADDDDENENENDDDDDEVLIIVEHLSTVAPLAVLRMWRYTSAAWMHHMDEKPSTLRPPLVIPYILHHSERGWTAPATLTDLFAQEPALDARLQPFVPDFRVIVDDLTAHTQTALRARSMSAVARLALWALKVARTPGAVAATIRDWVEVFREALDAPGDTSMIVQYVLYVSDVDAGVVQRFLVHDVGQGGEELYMTAGQALREQGREQGRDEGVQALRNTLMTLLRQRFGASADEASQRIQHADLEHLERWIARVIPARHLDDVFDDPR